VSETTATFTVERRLTGGQAERRERVIEAARALALAPPPPPLTMGAVADRSGLARATLYRYFASRDHLLAEVTSAWGAELTADLRRRPPRGGLARRVAAVFTRVLDAARDEPRLAAAVLASATSPDPAAVRAQGRVATLIQDYLATVLDPARLGALAELERLMGHVFFSAVVNMTTGRITHAEAVRAVESAARLYFDAHPDQGGPP
jgi:AcrR family transcriptional regulator